MRKTLIALKSILLVASLAAVFVFTSCGDNKKDVVTPSYIGTWTSTVVIKGQSTVVDLTLSETTFVQSAFVQYLSLRIKATEVVGDYNIVGSTIEQTPSKIGIFNTQTMSMAYYQKGDGPFDTIFASNSSMKGSCSLADNKLTITLDDNYGIFDSNSRTIVYTRK